MTPNLRKRIASQVLSNKPITVQRRSLAKRAKTTTKISEVTECKAYSPSTTSLSASSLSTHNYWLMKAEPESRIVKGKDVKFSIDDLAAMPNATSAWDGVRNYEARNIMRDRMKIGDKVLFYHSNCKEPGIAGIAQVIREGYPDHTALDASHPYYDPKLKSGDENRWFMVDVKFVCKFPRFIPLEELKRYKATHLSNMILLNRGRLSVQPVTRDEFDFINNLAQNDNDKYNE